MSASAVGAGPLHAEFHALGSGLRQLLEVARNEAPALRRLRGLEETVPLGGFMRAYLSGPISGLPEHNFPAFHAAAADLRARGWEVFNPAESFDGRTDLPRCQYMRVDTREVTQCDALVLLPGWQHSDGARWEIEVAKRCGTMILDYPGLERYRPETALEEGQRLVHGERGEAYGHPTVNHQRTAWLFTAWLRARYSATFELGPDDVCWFNILQKISRSAHSLQRDTAVDVAGYAENLDMIRQAREGGSNLSASTTIPLDATFFGGQDP